MTAMNKGEREDSQRLVRRREKILKSAAKQRSAELLADFENQMGQEYRFDQDETWQQATELADREVANQKTVAARCRELGIPDQFAPTLRLEWSHRGYGTSIKARREELQRMAGTQIQAIEQKAIVQIELQCLAAQEQIAVAGLTSDAAKSFIESIPSIETLMPAFSFEEVAGEADPPVAQQLVSPSALRQRRYRERQAALRNATQTLPLRNGDAA
jgi:hypothetical protein